MIFCRRCLKKKKTQNFSFVLSKWNLRVMSLVTTHLGNHSSQYYA